MKVSELIEILKMQPQDAEVAVPSCSEYCLLNEPGIYIKELCEARPDGWIANKRPDKTLKKYLVFSV